MFLFVFCFFKQMTAYELRISDCSSDVCSSDLLADVEGPRRLVQLGVQPDRALEHLLQVGEQAHLEFFAAEARAHLVETGQRLLQRPRRLGGPAERGPIGRAAGRERGCQYGENTGGAVPLNKKNKST